ncbi:MAG: heparinase II/III family protein [Planctomycetes bacterium]|nr:heparinase II/III family protein [Planctomycetota bacterium]
MDKTKSTASPASARIYESDLDYRDDPLVVLENEHLLAAFEPARGGRCTSFLDKQAAIDFVALNRWQDHGIGLLDDFNGNGLYPAPFRSALMAQERRSGPRGVELVLSTLERRYKTVPLDVRLTKRIRLEPGSRRLDVVYELTHAMRCPLTLDLNLCNFIRAWGESMEIAVPARHGLRVEKVRSGWQIFREEDLTDGWCAVFGPRTGRGLRITAEAAHLKACSAYARANGFSIDLDTFLFVVGPGRTLRWKLSVELLRECFEARDAAPPQSVRRPARGRDPSTARIASGLPVASEYLRAMGRKRTPPHPRLFLSAEELPSLRSAQGDAWRPRFVEHILAAAEQWLHAPGAASGPSPLYPAYAWLLSAEKRYFDAARQVLLKTAGDGAADPILRTILYDWLYEGLRPEERGAVRGADLARLRRDYAHHVSAAGHHPWGLMGTGMKRHCPNPLAWVEIVPFGLAGLAYLGEVPDAPAWVEFARRTAFGFLEYFSGDVGSDGEYFEGSCYYYAFMPTFVAFVEALARVTGDDLFEAAPWLRLNAAWNTFCSVSGREMIPFGDSSIARWWISVRQAPFLYLLARRFQDAEAQFTADQQAMTFFDWWGPGGRPPPPKKVEHEDFALWAHLWRDPSLAPSKPLGPLTRHFHGCGWAVLREGFGDKDLVIGFQAWKTVGHCHGVQGHFVVLSGPEFLITDPGYILHSPYHAARWHNLLAVDGQEQVDWDSEHFQGSPAGCLRRVPAPEGCDHFIADLTMLYRGLLASYQRHLIYVRPRTVILLDDALAETERQFDLYLQCAARPRRSGGGFRFEHEGQHASVQFLNAAAWSSDTTVRTDGYRPQVALKLSARKPASRFLSALVLQFPRDGLAEPLACKASLGQLALKLPRGVAADRLVFVPEGPERHRPGVARDGVAWKPS